MSVTFKVTCCWDWDKVWTAALLDFVIGFWRRATQRWLASLAWLCSSVCLTPHRLYFLSENMLMLQTELHSWFSTNLIITLIIWVIFRATFAGSSFLNVQDVLLFCVFWFPFAPNLDGHFSQFKLHFCRLNHSVFIYPLRSPLGTCSSVYKCPCGCHCVEDGSLFSWWRIV